MSEEIPLQSRLEAYYRETVDREVVISDFTQISDGWETEVYSFKLTLHHQAENLILRIYPGANAAEKCKREFQGLNALWGFGYPAPETITHETGTNWLSKPFLIMQKIDGRPLGQVMREDTSREPELLTRFVQLLVDLHQLNPYFVPFLEKREVYPFLERKLAHMRTLMINQLGQIWAIPVLDWLETHSAAIPIPKRSILHGDFHPHNVLLTPEDKLYVIDWSGIEIGYYYVDLAWTLLLISTSGYPELRPVILSEYERLSGHTIENIEYFDVIATLRRLFDMAVSLGSGAESLGMRPDTVEIMRRQHDHYQQVYDLLCQYTGLHLPEIERLLDTLRG